MSKSRINFWLDAVIFATFAVTVCTGLLLWLVVPGGRGTQALTFLGWTHHNWVELHNWAGVSMLVGTVIHLALHWDWIKCAASRLFKPLAKQARLNFWLDSVMLMVFTLVNVSGLVAWLVLPSGGFQGGRNSFFNATFLALTRPDWIDLHWYTGLALITILAVHLVLHWRWILSSMRRYIYTSAREPQRFVGV